MSTMTAADPKALVLTLLEGSAWPGAREALEAVRSIPVPTTRSEAWKYTRVSRLINQPYAAPDGHAVVTLPERLPFPATRVVFVNGHFRPDLSDALKADKGVVIDSIANHLTHGPLKARYGNVAPVGNRLFTAMNSAAPTDGLIVLATKDARTSRPIHLLRVTAAEAPTLIQPRDLIMLHEGASVELIVEHASASPGMSTSFVNSVRESVVSEDASLTLHLLQNEPEGPADIGMDAVRVAAKGRFTIDTTTLYGSLVRNELDVALAGPGAHAELNGAYLLNGTTHCDNHTRIGHDVADCTSDELYKGIVGGKATGVFNGKVHVKQDAQHTQAYQRNANILQGDDGRIYSKPELEIYADDVKCSHGCTIGRLDEQAVFYLRSRGVSEAEARRMVSHAFMAEVVERITNPDWRKYLEGLIDRKLEAL